ncbi:TIGR03773 family transporter-associated surface protein [Cellulosimicrobium cellulans]|uniref:TIGR03773 family transporter-associated surface protein n=1 Tax=Cellulosimicrobium cellulans TaxID=1710 RepID=UPI00209691E4|nr:TIGR03773 family transporter-associated surface protein [Cellulosimicrobium cellulans]MCO7273660.1 TIGR03773 family transporter-associated surface protein [Cellulosimicrobium cellulans]
MSVAIRGRAWAAALGLLALLASFVVPTAAGALPTASAQTVPDREFVLTHGHVDGFETIYDAASGRLVLSVKDDTRIHDTGAVFRVPETTTFAYQDERSRTTLPPATAGWAFLGKHGGTTAWLGTQSGGDQTYAPWVGWSTERLLTSLAGTGVTPAAGTPVSLDVRVQGPGDVFSFQNDAFGGPINVYVNTLTGAGTIPVAQNAHVHTNWVFTAEGDYTFVVTPSLATADGRTIAGSSATYHFRVGERAPEPVTTTVAVTSDHGSYLEGQSAVFTASQEPVTELAVYRWEVAAAGSQEFVAVEGASGASYERELTLADDGAQVRAVLLDGKRVVGTSEPVTLAVTAAAAAHTVQITGLQDWYALNSEILLEAVIEPAVEDATFRWERRFVDASEFTPFYPTVFRDADLTLLANEYATGVAWRVVALDAQGAELAMSEPVVIPGVREVPWEAPVLDDTPVVLTEGHIDLFSLYLDAGRLVLSVVDDTRQHASRKVDRAPSAVTVSVDPELSATPVPDTGYDFLGEPGNEVYVLPGSGKTGLPWPGWSTEQLEKSLPAGETVSDLRYEIEAEGPGDVSAWAGAMNGSPSVHFDSGDDEPDVISVHLGAHVHTSWGFTEQGTYTLRVTAKGSLSDGTSLVSDTETYTFQVGEAAPEPVTTTVTVTSNKDSYAEGESAVLTASQDPVTDLVTYRWEVAEAGSDEFVAVEGASGASYERALTTADDGARVRAVLLDGERVAGTSEPLRLDVTAKPDPGPGPNPDASEPNREFVLNKGHIDGFETTYDASSEELVLSVKDDTRLYDAGPTFRRPADVTIAYEDARAVQKLPAAQGNWSFLGEYGGADAWIGTQTGEDQTYLPWMGWSTERLLSTLQGTGITPAAGSPVSLAVEVTGPGDVFTFQNDSFGNPINRYVDTTTSAGGTIPVTANAHVHTNWVFTAEGDYHLTVTPSLKTADNRTITGDSADYHVRVGAYMPPFEPLPEDQLTDANRGGLTLDKDSYPLGSDAVASSSALTDARRVVAYVYSEPTSAGELTAADGAVTVTIPSTVGTGAHKLALYDSPTGELLGWAPFTATAAANDVGGAGDGDGGGAGAGDGSGSDAGTGAGSTTPEQCIPTPVTSEVKTGAVSGITEGHFDFGSMVENGTLVAKTKDDRKQPPSWVDPESLTFRLGDAAKREVPAGADFAFLGKAGATIWSIGQVQEPGVPWVGWNTQHPSLIEAAAGPVTYTLDRVDGPGKLGVYATGNFGGVGTKYFGTMDGFPRSTSVPLNQHVHGNWAFSEQGVYKVTFTLSVPLKSGGTVSDSATITFSVGDSSGTATKTTYVGKTASGEDCELSADQKAALATTGADPASALALGALLLVAGTTLYGASRRRRGARSTV